MKRGMLSALARRSLLAAFHAVALSLRASEAEDNERGPLQNCASAASATAAVSSTMTGSATYIYQARFESGSWSGQLVAFPIDRSIGAIDKPAWDASALLPIWTAREIITSNSDGTPIAFRWANLDSDRRRQLGEMDSTAEATLDYLRGDASNEGGGQFRVRAATKLGDIIDSVPAYVGAPNFNYPDGLETTAYSSFAAATRSRPAMLYVGANDGMLHGFDANSGRETFGFVPGPVFRHLHDLANQSYVHRYYVDGSPNPGDAFFKGTWHTVLAGGLNGGGQGIYALDITDPNNLANAESNPSGVILWQYTDDDDADLGYTFSQPAIVRLNNGKWAAVFGNGYDNTAAPAGDAHVSSTGDAALFLVDIADGSLIRKIEAKSGTSSDPTGAARANGLSTPVLVDLNGDRIVDYAYAGDLFGNLWKFDLRGATPGTWEVAFKDSSSNPQPLFRARDGLGNAQPITERPRVLRGPNGSEWMVLFGTGKYLAPSDRSLNPRRDQSFYGILDANTNTAADRVDGRSSLQQQTILAETSVRLTSNNALNGKSGWYIDLVSPASGYENEKQISEAAIRNGHVIFTTLIPDQMPCALVGKGWLMELDAFSGSRPSAPAFDINGDSKIDREDLAAVTLSDGVETTTAPSAVQARGSISTMPLIYDKSTSEQRTEYKYTAGDHGEIQVTLGNPGKSAVGRQSWRQLR